MKIKLYLLAFFSIISLDITHATGSTSYCGTEAKACLKYGAKVFQQRCSLCHGNNGMGEGILPLSLKSYPETNLLIVKQAVDEKTTRDIIIYGASLPNIGAEMPPWGDELTLTQLESVTLFVNQLKTNNAKARLLLAELATKQQPSLKIGRAVYKGRCVLCHGEYGLGDGKMAKIIKNPPPFNLTLSRMPDQYLKDIILKGGEKMSRSPRMPPWEGTLTESEVESVIIYIKKLRN